MKIVFHMTLVALLMLALGCDDGGNQVIESAPDPDAMSLVPGAASESMEDSAAAIENSMNPLAK